MRWMIEPGRLDLMVSTGMNLADADNNSGFPWGIAGDVHIVGAGLNSSG